MNRFILFAAMLLMAIGCHRADPEIKVEVDPDEEVKVDNEEEAYIFHDDFYYTSSGRIELEKCPEDFLFLQYPSCDFQVIYEISPPV